jgi:hypothetical protein
MRCNLAEEAWKVWIKSVVMAEEYLGDHRAVFFNLGADTVLERERAINEINDLFSGCPTAYSGYILKKLHAVEQVPEQHFSA